MGKTRIQIAKLDIVALFERQNQKIYRVDELATILRENRGFWRLTLNLQVEDFVEFLLKSTPLKKVVLASQPNATVRYVWGQVGVFELALSINSNSYLSHGSAVFLHALNEQLPKLIYVNHEQPLKSQPRGTLSQDAINKAFSQPARVSHAIYKLDDYQIVSLNGKHTGRLEVGEIKEPDGATVPVTKLERTLIDITVRPNYAGGVFQVLEAFKSARESVSVNVLVATLKRLDYLYPYHQCLGFYMERAGFDRSRLDLLKAFPRQFDFYLANELEETDYDPNWKLFFPRGM